jgi:succinate dehydrogenase / fumarate reductase, flavoprotein subunit
MERYCAVFRTEPSWMRAWKSYPSFIKPARTDQGMANHSMILNPDLAKTLELENMLLQASVSLHSAIGGKESWGAHAWEDLPKRSDENWLSTRCAGSTMTVARHDYKPVHLRPLSNEVKAIPPKERVYDAKPVRHWERAPKVSLIEKH